MVTSLTYIIKSMYWQSPNHVVLGGNLTFDPVIREVKGAEGNAKVVEFSIANNLKSAGSPAGKPNYFKCEAWGKTAENICEYFKKGDSIIVNGCLQWHSWEDSKTQEKREAIRVRVESFYFTGSQARKGGEEKQQGSPRPAPLNRPVPPPPLPQGNKKSPPLYDVEMAAADDSIPF